ETWSPFRFLESPFRSSVIADRTTSCTSRTTRPRISRLQVERIGTGRAGRLRCRVSGLGSAVLVRRFHVLFFGFLSHFLFGGPPFVKVSMHRRGAVGVGPEFRQSALSRPYVVNAPTIPYFSVASNSKFRMNRGTSVV